jgi:hypothetical protein
VGSSLGPFVGSALADDCEPSKNFSSWRALAGDREPGRVFETELWLVTASLAGTGGNNSGLER